VASARPRLQPRSALATAERTLVAVILARPRALSRFDEELGSLVFSTPDLEHLRQRLVATLSETAQAAEDLPGSLRAAGLSEGLAEVLADILADPLLARHRALEASAPAEDLEALWRENLAVVRAAGERVDESARRDEASAAGEDDAAMARRRLLKLAELGDGEEDDERR
jgi:hypothetical protein